jgi:predicted TIM-barrel fold metal-dependent hydrolase
MVIDIHTHLTGIVDFFDRDPDLPRAVRSVFGLPNPPAQPMSTFLAALDAAGIDRAVVLPIDCTTAHGCRIYSNELIAEIVAKYPRLIGFASVDPNLDDAPQRLEQAVKSYGLAGLKLDPALQLFDIDDRERAYPVYAMCASLQIPLLIHCGLSWAPLGRSARAHPLRLEAVACDFPELNIIIAHAGWPWVGEALALALKFPNVYLDTAVIYSGTPADSLRHVLADVIGIDVLRRSLRDKVVYGSNAPRTRPKRGVGAVRALGLEPELERRILHDNAAALLHLEEVAR